MHLLFREISRTNTHAYFYDTTKRVQLQELFHSIVCMDAENRARHAPTGKQQLHFKERCQSSL